MQPTDHDPLQNAEPDNGLPEQPSAPTQRQDYWGLNATLLLGLLVFILFSLSQAAVLASYGLYLVDWDFNTDLEPIIEPLLLDGFAISIAEIPSALIGVMAIMLFIHLRQTLSVRDYLHGYFTTAGCLLKWLGVMLVAIVSIEVTNQGMQRDIPDFMTRVYGSTDNHLLLLIAVVIAAPLFEEFLFRGFILEGLRHTWLGNSGAILLTAGTWAIIHLQYDWLDIFSIFLIGILLGFAKIKTRSIYTPIAMHAFMNLTASIMMAMMMNETA